MVSVIVSQIDASGNPSASSDQRHGQPGTRALAGAATTPREAVLSHPPTMTDARTAAQDAPCMTRATGCERQLPRWSAQSTPDQASSRRHRHVGQEIRNVCKDEIRTHL